MSCYRPFDVVVVKEVVETVRVNAEDEDHAKQVARQEDDSIVRVVDARWVDPEEDGQADDEDED